MGDEMHEALATYHDRASGRRIVVCSCSEQVEITAWINHCSPLDAEPATA